MMLSPEKIWKIGKRETLNYKDKLDKKSDIKNDDKTDKVQIKEEIKLRRKKKS